MGLGGIIHSFIYLISKPVNMFAIRAPFSTLHAVTDIHRLDRYPGLLLAIHAQNYCVHPGQDHRVETDTLVTEDGHFKGVSF